MRRRSNIEDHLAMVSGLGQPPQQFTSQVLPNMVIGMGPQMVAPGTFHPGTQYPLTGEATEQIDPNTGLPMWVRTTPMEAVIPGQYFDIRNELVPQLPDWVVRRERKRREQLLTDTGASGAMRTALNYDLGETIALPDGWQTTNLIGLMGLGQDEEVFSPSGPPQIGRAHV